MGTVEHDTNAYHNKLAFETEISEKCAVEVNSWSDRELIENIKDYYSDEFYDFIMEDLRLAYCRLSGRDPDIMRTKLGGIPNLLIELFQPENYLAYYRDLTEEAKKTLKATIADLYADKKISELEDQ